MDFLNVTTGRGRRADCVLAAALLAACGAAAPSAQAGLTPIYETRFNSDEGFVLGDLEGQDGWAVELENAVANVQDSVVREGDQAIEVIDGGSFGRAERMLDGELTLPQLIARYDMFVPAAWAVGQEDNRFEANGRLEWIDPDNGLRWGIEWGLLRVSDTQEYNGLPTGAGAVYIEITFDGELIDGVYHQVNFNGMVDDWHRYRLDYDQLTDRAVLIFDRNEVVEITVPVEIPRVNLLQLQNQRWATVNEGEDSALYFDLLRILLDEAEPPILPDLFVRNRGLPVSGDLPDLFESDDSYVVTRPDVFGPSADPPVSLRIRSMSPIASPSQLRVTVESHVSVDSIRQRIALFNYDTGEFDIFDSRIASLTDETVTIVVDDNPARYVRPNSRRMLIRVDYNAVAFSIIPTWTASIDRSIWRVIP